MKLAFIGVGNMGGALLKGALHSGFHQAEDLLIYHPKPHRQEELKEQYGVKTTGKLTDLKDIPAVLVGVKPYQLDTVLGELGQNTPPDQLMISVAAGWSVSQLSEALGHRPAHVVRAMPNTPVQVGHGVTAWCASESTTAEQREYTQAFFAKAGTAVELPETQFDAFTALCGSGPAYICLLFEALIDAAVREGLPRPLASKMAIAMVEGTAVMAKESQLSAADLRAAVTSPGGTTAAGLAELEHNGLRSAFLDTIRAAATRSREMNA